ncbi:MAG: ATP-binding protein [Bacteroidetes bacterium]|nr:ATP-binding protein [Bacteroidota bacterium]
MDTLQTVTTPDLKKRRIAFSSTTDNIVLVEKMIDDICSEFDLDENNYGNILVAVTEAVNNAIYHGNKLNPSKKVRVSFEPGEDKLSFTVEDEGMGFDYNNLPDPTSAENIEKPYGRGIFLIKNLSDGVTFLNSGRTVEISFFVGRN